MTISSIEKGRKIEYYGKKKERNNVSYKLWVDQFSKFLLGLTIALCIISLFVPRRLGSLFSTLILLLIFYTYFRMFSRNIYKRAAENEKYMRILGSWRNKVANEKNLAGQRKYYHFYKCPGCGQRIRIPKGHGKIQIRCPKCNATFIRRS